MPKIFLHLFLVVLLYHQFLHQKQQQQSQPHSGPIGSKRSTLPSGAVPSGAQPSAAFIAQLQSKQAAKKAASGVISPPSVTARGLGAAQPAPTAAAQPAPTAAAGAAAGTVLDAGLNYVKALQARRKGHLIMDVAMLFEPQGAVENEGP